jgi:hypothetical protein
MITLSVWTLVVLLGVWSVGEMLLVLAWWDKQHEDEYADDDYDPWSEA